MSDSVVAVGAVSPCGKLRAVSLYLVYHNRPVLQIAVVADTFAAKRAPLFRIAELRCRKDGTQQGKRFRNAEQPGVKIFAK